MQAPEAKTFRIDGAETTLADLLAANADDPELCDWARNAKPGDQFAALVECECIAVHAAQDLTGATPDEAAGIRWWNALTEPQRAAALAAAKTAVPAEAWAHAKRAGTAS